MQDLGSSSLSASLFAAVCLEITVAPRGVLEPGKLCLCVSLVLLIQPTILFTGQE